MCSSSNIPFSYDNICKRLLFFVVGLAEEQCSAACLGHHKVDDSRHRSAREDMGATDVGSARQEVVRHAANFQLVPVYSAIAIVVTYRRG